MGRRLIDADALIKRFKALMGKEIKLLMLITDVIKIIKEQPAVDAVEVVRCCQCKYSEKYKCEVYPTYNPLVCRRREHYSESVDGYDFCSYGERRSEMIALEDTVDLDAINKANGAAMRRVIDFVVGERRSDE